MLSYQHGYHAGNFADVHKHTALCLLANHLSADPRLVTYIDSHAGRGLYDLSGEQSQKTSEWKDGVAKLKAAQPTDPSLNLYLQRLNQFEGNIYPGSPALLQSFMADNHRGILFELHPAENEALTESLKDDKRLRILKEDATEALINYLPSRKAPGLLLIDPSYEIKDDYDKIARLAKTVSKRWPAGIIMIWYPILPEGRHEAIKTTLKDFRFYDLIGPQKDRGMYGTGLGLFNASDDFHDRFIKAHDVMKDILF